MWSLAVGVVAAAAVSTASACTTDANCSLNGACLPTGSCVCDRPWTGGSCSQLDFNPTPVGGAYGYGTPFAVTSWGGNSIYDNATKTWHLYVTEMQGTFTLSVVVQGGSPCVRCRGEAGAAACRSQWATPRCQSSCAPWCGVNAAACFIFSAVSRVNTNTTE